MKCVVMKCKLLKSLCCTFYFDLFVFTFQFHATIFPLSLVSDTVDVTALRQMGENDLKELGVPTVFFSFLAFLLFHVPVSFLCPLSEYRIPHTVSPFHLYLSLFLTRVYVIACG